MSKERIPRKPPFPEEHSPSTPSCERASVFQLAARVFRPDIIVGNAEVIGFLGRLCDKAESSSMSRDPRHAEDVQCLRTALRSHTCGTHADRKP
jgi:hypothetical protein